MLNLEDFCGCFHELLGGEPEQVELMKKGRRLCSELVQDPGWFGDFLGKLLLDRESLARQESSIYPNEFHLYRCPDRSFSVLAYIWEPWNSSAVHDHGSWGIIGALIQPAREVLYRRLDSGAVEGYAELEETGRRILKPGETSWVLPLDRGIHLMEGAVDELSVTINVYGRSIRKGYIQFFDPQQKKVWKVYPPLIYRRVLAVKALPRILGPRAEDLLRAIPRPLPDYLEKEIERALAEHLHHRATEITEKLGKKEQTKSKDR